MESSGDDETAELRKRIANMERWAHQLAKDKFDLEHRVRNLTRSLGFESLQEAENSQNSFNPPADAGAKAASTSIAIVHKPPLLTNDIDAYVKRIDELEKEGERARAETSRYVREVELVSAENRSLISSMEETRSHAAELEKANVARRKVFDERLALRDATIAALKTQVRGSRGESPTIGAPRDPTFNSSGEEGGNIDLPPPPSRPRDIFALTNEVQALKARNVCLQLGYDTLLQEKFKLSAIYKRRVGEWKSFKEWLYNEALKKAAPSSLSTASSERGQQHNAEGGMGGKLRRATVTEIAITVADKQGRTALDIIGDLVDAAEQDAHEVLRSNDAPETSALAAPFSLITSAKHIMHEGREQPADAQVPPLPPATNAALLSATSNPKTMRTPPESHSNTSPLGNLPPVPATNSPALSLGPFPPPKPAVCPNSAASEGTAALRADSRSTPTTPLARTKPKHRVAAVDEIIDLTANSQGSETQAAPSEGSPTQPVPTSSPDKSASPHSPPHALVGKDSSSLIFLGETRILEATSKDAGKSFTKFHPGQEAMASQPSNTPAASNSRSIFFASRTSTPKARMILKPIPPPPLPLADIIRSRLAPETDDPGPSQSSTSKFASTFVSDSARPRSVMNTPNSRSQLPDVFKGIRAPERASLTEPQPSRTRTRFTRDERAGNVATLTPTTGKERSAGDRSIKRKGKGKMCVDTELPSEGEDPARDAKLHGVSENESGSGGVKSVAKQGKRAAAIRRVSKSTSSPAVFQFSLSSPISHAENAPASGAVCSDGSPPRREQVHHFSDLETKSASDYQRIYAQYKGRGRYAQSTVIEHDEDINSRYEIDRERNDGLQHPYDEVVRNKSSRKRMHAVDCPCCKDYYEAVGPLPPRLAPPPWKTPSPPSSPSKSQGERRYRSASPTSPSKHQRQKQREIQEHRQQVSRHRHRWAPPNTPPDYWAIGFPDTQQLENINKRAKDMNAAKRKYIEDEASKGNGRYRKRR